MLAPGPDEALVAPATGVEATASLNETLPQQSDIYTGRSTLTRTQASPPVSGNDTCRESRNGGGNLDTRRNGTRRQRPQTLSGSEKEALRVIF